MQPRLLKLSWWLFGAVIALQFVMPFVYPLVGHDAAVHLNWLSQFPKVSLEGNLYPRWMPDSFWGFGSPAFYFYPPLAYWCAGLISFIFPSPVVIYQTLGLLATITSVITCYWYLRTLAENNKSAWAGALVYGIFPYRLLDLYLRNAIGEHVALIFLPLVFLGVELSFCSNNKKIYLQSIIISAVGWAGLFLSNIPMAVIVIYTVPIYSWIRSRMKKQYSQFLFPFIGAAIGGMVAAIYLLPAYEFYSSIKLSYLFERWNIEGITGFPGLDIFNGDYRYFYTGLVVVYSLGIWIAYKFFRERKLRNIFLTSYILLVFSLVFQIPFLLKWLWNILPLFKFIQFAWRFDVIILLASAIFVTAKFSSAKIFIGLSSLVTLTIAIGYFYTMRGWNWSYRADPKNIDAGEYLPAQVTGDFKIAKDKLEEHAEDDLIEGSDSIHFRSISDDRVTFNVENNTPVRLTFHKMYFPAWTLRNSEEKIIPMTPDSLGRINAVLPPGNSEYTLSLEESDAEKSGKMISIAGLSLLCIAISFTIFLRSPKASSPAPSSELRHNSAEAAPSRRYGS